jgi:hypothetical protein
MPLLLLLGASGSTPAVESDIREAIVARMLATPSLTSIVGSKLRPLSRPQSDQLPTITFTVSANPRGHWLSGGNGQGIARVQFDCWATTLAQCVQIKRAIEEAFDGGRWSAAGVTIQWSKQLDEQDLGDDPSSGDDAPTRRILVDYAFKYLCSIANVA